ncbi:MAG: L-aspartate oxidase [Candidatus Diapherotrites archaeon]
MREKFDLTIIGSGVSGLSALIEACKQKDKTIAVLDSTKGLDSNTYYAQGGIACAIGKKDSWKKHAKDTILAGKGLCNEKVVNLITSKGKRTIRELIDLGLKFDGDKKIELGLEGGHSQRRILHINGDQTGKNLLIFLKKIAKEQKNATFFYNQEVNNIIQEKKFILQTQSQEIEANSIIIATGGYAAFYEKTTNPKNTVGKGIILAHKIGCEITNMEFVQFHPTTLRTNYKNLLLTEAIRGEGARIVDEKGKQIINPLLTRDKVAITIQQKIEEGKKVFLDATKIIDFKKKFPIVYKSLIENGINPEEQKIPIEPAAHYTIGGIKTNEKGMTNIKGIYAIGECSCNGFHGANRLASNSLLEGLVMGKIAAKEALKKKETTKIKKTEQNKITKKEELEKARKIMWDYCGIIRKKKKLEEGLNKIRALLKQTKNQETLLICKMTFEAALKRKKSIGTHYIEE